MLKRREISSESASELELVRGLSKRDIAKLASIGVESCCALAGMDAEELVARLKWTPNKAWNIVLHARAIRDNKVYVKRVPSLPNCVIYFYDVETFGGVTYLHGIIKLSREEREEHSFLAKMPREECEIWNDFLEFIAREENPCVIYSWTNYEWQCVSALWEKYGGNKKGWELLKNNLTDQYLLIRDHFALPTRSYGLKSVAPIFGFDWHTPEPSGLKAEQWYRSWLETGDRRLLDEIVTYNLDDVRAMERIHYGITEILSSLNSTL